MAKLTLSVEDEVVSRAKDYARSRGLSVSKIVESYLAAVAEPISTSKGATSILRTVRGVLKNANIDDYREHLVAKYR